MPQYVRLPDGNLFPLKEGEDPASALGAAEKLYPASFGLGQKTPEKQPESGFMPALKSGIAGLKADVAALKGKVGIGSLEEAEQEIAKQKAYQAKTFKPTEEGFSEAPIANIKELLGGSLPYMAAPLVAGGAAAALPLTGLAATAAGVGAAGLASAGQFTGSNITRQMDTGKTLGETDLGAAALAALPQAALDTLSLRMMPGVGKILQSAGINASEKVAANYAKEALKKTVADYALSTGKTMGVEGLTEASQQVFERMQAGLQITDPEARQEYFDSFVGGAVLGGVIAPVGRRVERGQEQGRFDAQQREVQRAQAVTDAQARAEAAAAEQARRQTPEYAKEKEAEYQAAEKVKADLQAQIQKSTKTQPLTEAQKQDNAAINAQLKEHAPILKAAASEYRRVRSVLEAAKEQERVAAMSPEDYMLEQMQSRAGQGIQVSGRKGAARSLYAPEAAPPPLADTTLTDYATQQIGAARAAGDMDLGSYADYLMQDPKLAQQLVENKIKIPSIQEGNAAFTLSTVENNNLLSGLKLRLAEQEKKAKKAADQEMATRQADLKTQQQTAPVDERMAGFTEGMDVLENLRRTGETNFDYLNPIFEKGLGGAQPVVKVNEAILPSDKSVNDLSKLYSLLDNADRADQDYDTAKRANEQAAASAALGRGNLAVEQVGALAKNGPVHVQENIVARRAQQDALARMEEEINKIRADEFLGKEKGEMAGGTLEVALNRIERARADYISTALQEAAIARRAQGRPAMTVDEATKAASELHTALSEWVRRVQALPWQESLTEVVEQTAQMRGTKLVKGAETRMRDLRPLEERRFGAYHPAVAVIKEQLNDIRNKLANPPRALQRVETGPLKRQFAAEEATKTAEARGETAKTLTGELRRLQEYVGNLIDKALQRNIPEGETVETEFGPIRTQGIKEALLRVKDLIEDGKANRAMLDAAQNQAERILRGEDLGKQTYTRRVTAPGTNWKVGKVYENVPGKPSETRIGERGRVNKTLSYEAELAPEGSALRELQETLREYEKAQGGLDLDSQTAAKIAKLRAEGKDKEADALERLSVRQAQAQTELFPETREDVGYIRATASNFEKSPAVKAGRAAVDAARKVQKRRENKERKTREEEATKLNTLETLRGQIDNIKKDTRFFWTRFEGGRFSTAALAKAFVPYPDIGETPEEKALASRGLKSQKLTPKEKVAFEKLVVNFTGTKLPEYENKLEEAIKILGSGQQLIDTNNALLAFMQDTNASIKMQATEMAKELAPLLETVALLQEKKDRVLTKSEQKIVSLAGKISDVRNSYHEAIQKAFDKAKAEAQAAREELYAPDMQNAKAALDSANKKLATAQTRIEKMLAAAKKIEGREGEQKMLAAEQETAQALQDELNAAIQNLADIEAKLQEDFNGAEFTAQAMLDKLVVSERTKLEKLEGRFNELKAANNTNPLLAQKKAEADAQRAVVAIAETAARRNAEAVAKQQREMQAAVTARQTGTIQTSTGETLPGSRVTVPPIAQKNFESEVKELEKKLKTAQEKREELIAQKKSTKSVDNTIDKIETKLSGFRKKTIVEPIEKTTPDSRSAAARAQAATALMDRLQRAQEKQQAVEKMGELKAQFDTVQAEGRALEEQGKSTAQIVKQLQTLKAQYAYYKNLAGIAKVAPVAGPVARTQTAAPSTLRTGTASNLKGLEGIEGTGGGTQKNLSQARQVRKLSPAQEARQVLENNVISAEAALKQAKKVTAAAEDRLAAASNTVAREESQAALTRAETNERAKEDALELAKQALLTPAEKKAQAKLEAATQAELDKGGEFAKLMDEAEELNLTVPHDDVKFAVRDNDIMGVIDGLAKHGSTPAIRERAKGLREFLYGTTIGVDRFVKYRGEMVAGLYEEGRNKITMHPNRVTEEDLLHELTHAATTKAMRTPDAKLTPMQREAKQGIINLFKAAEGRMDLTGQYGIKDVHEFMSEVNSSKDFRDRLDGIGKPMSLWQRLKRWIAGLFNQPPSKEALDLIEKIYMPSETYFAKEGEQQAFAKAINYGEDDALGQLAQRAVAQKQGWWQTVRGGSNYALEFEMQTTDMRAALRKVMEMGAKAFGDSRLFQQAMYSYTKADQKMPLVLTALSDGPLEIYEDAKGLKGIRSTGKNSAKDVFAAVSDIPDRYGDETAKMSRATMYLIAQRAANKGWPS